MRNLVISVALIAFTAPLQAASDYPVAAVWAEHLSFCADPVDQTASWQAFEPESDTPLDRLRTNRTAIYVTGNEIKYPVYRKEVAGRVLFGFKSQFEKMGGGRPTVYCSIYDFEARDKLDVEAWASVIGKPDKTEAGKGYQRIAWDIDGYNGSDLFVTLQLPEMFPPPDSVGFNGLQIRNISRDIE